MKSSGVAVVFVVLLSGCVGSPDTPVILAEAETSQASCTAVWTEVYSASVGGTEANPSGQRWDRLPDHTRAVRYTGKSVGASLITEGSILVRLHDGQTLFEHALFGASSGPSHAKEQVASWKANGTVETEWRIQGWVEELAFALEAETCG